MVDVNSSFLQDALWEEEETLLDQDIQDCEREIFAFHMHQGVMVYGVPYFEQKSTGVHFY